MFETEFALTFGELAAIFWIAVVIISLIGLLIFAIFFLFVEKGGTGRDAEDGSSSSTVTTDASATGDREEIPPQLKILLHDLFGSDSELDLDSDYEAMIDDLDLCSSGYKPISDSDL